MSFAVITENDESQWDDETGAVYHFPVRAKQMLPPGTKVVYYKGRIRDRRFASTRLSPGPHYFGIATVDRLVPDPDSSKGDLHALLRDHHRFESPVPFADESGYLETPMIQPTRESNYFRDGTRRISEAVYDRIIRGTKAFPTSEGAGAEERTDPTFESGVEGQQHQRYVTTYERDPRLRAQAKAIHGTRCKGCGKTSAETYGEDFAGIIHIHHVKPVSTLGGATVVDPSTDLIPLCPNCHAVVHSKRGSTLSVEDLRLVVERRSTSR